MLIPHELLDKGLSRKFFLVCGVDMSAIEHASLPNVMVAIVLSIA